MKELGLRRNLGDEGKRQLHWPLSTHDARDHLSNEQELFDSLLKVGVKDLAQPLTCPKCGGEDHCGHGRYREMKRFKCKNCGKTFTERTGTVTWAMKKRAKLKSYFSCMLDGHSIRECARMVGIDKNTAFSWRHKILSSLHEWKKENFHGLVEMKELSFSYSVKGRKKPRSKKVQQTEKLFAGKSVKAFISLDRIDGLQIQVIGRGELTKKMFHNYCRDGLASVSGICSEHMNLANMVISTARTDLPVRHFSATLKVSDQVFNTDRVMRVELQLKKWLSRFFGVASKYLQNYLSWFSLLADLNSRKHDVLKFAKISGSARNSWPLWKQTENSTIFWEC